MEQTSEECYVKHGSTMYWNNATEIVCTSKRHGQSVVDTRRQ